MRQLTFIAQEKFEWWDVPEPVLQSATDALVQPIAVARCDLDYYIATGAKQLPGPFSFGHEAVAIVIQTGSEVTNVQPGNKVVVPFQISCGTCSRCVRGCTNACTSVPFRSSFGLAPLSGVDHGGALSELMRIPFANHMLVPLPASCSAESGAAAADNLSDGYRAVAEPLQRWPEANVLIIGGLAQSVGLYAAQCAVALGAARIVYADWDDSRLALAARIGAEPRYVQYHQGIVAPERFEITVEASGLTPGLLYAIASTAPCGTCTVVATLEPSVSLPLPAMYGSGIELRVGRAQARSVIPEVLDRINCGQIHPELLVGRTVPFSVAAEAMTDPCSKMIFENDIV